MLLKHRSIKKRMMTRAVIRFFSNKHVKEGGKAVKDSLGGAWNLPVQAPAAPAWSKSLTFRSNKNLFRKEATEKGLDPVLQS